MRVFRSRIDAAIVMLMVIPIVVVIAVVSVKAKGDMRVLVVVIPVVLVVSLFPMLTFRSTDYRIDGDDLRIRSGLISWHVAIHSIETIVPTRSIASAPALSLDRLAIHYRKDGARKTILVSPLDKRGFIAALKDVNPSIRA